MSELSEQVENLEAIKKEYEELCEVILATISLKGNQAHFRNMPDEWHEFVKDWVAQYRSLKSREIKRKVVES